VSPLALYREVPCDIRWRFWLSVVAVAYSTASVVAQASDGSAARAAGWDSPAVVLALVSILVSVGAFIQTVKSAVDAVAAERKTREEFQHQAHEQFARRDVIAAELTSIRNEITLLRAAVLGEKT